MGNSPWSDTEESVDVSTIQEICHTPHHQHNKVSALNSMRQRQENPRSAPAGGENRKLKRAHLVGVGRLSQVDSIFCQFIPYQYLELQLGISHEVITI